MSSKQPLDEKKRTVKDILRQRKKEQKKKLKEKRARLVVKNLAFSVTEEDLRQHFGKYGDITDIHILKKEDGKLSGCAFIQFKLVQKARKAKHYTHGKPLLGRNVDVDFAMSKKEYELLRFKKKGKNEENTVDVKVKVEPMDDSEIPEDTKSSRMEDDNESVAERSDSDEEGNNSDMEASDYDDETDESENEHNNDEELEKDDSEERKPRVVSNDVSEGKTVFIKNVPFTATNEDLKACMENYGPIYYALICVDKYTEHSKGTAFVKFCFKEDAEKVLQAGTELTLLGNVLDCHKALGKNEIHSQLQSKSNKKSENKDSRNLYLVKEGVILAGSKAAEGVSHADMLKRIQLEKYKSQMLRNLNMFVSRERLVVHNLPVTWDDKKFRELCKKFAGEGAKIKEARVMRNMRDIDAAGLGKSKGFGFVTLDSHESALTLLRNLNNNPNIFSAAKRPIITFSIEKKTAVRAKLKRLEKSRVKNPLSKQYDPEVVKKDKMKKEEREKSSKINENLKSFAGIPGKPGIQKMRSNYKLSEQASKHYERVKNEKKKKKNEKKSLKEKKKEFTKLEKQKIKKKDESDELSKMISKYKKTIRDAPDSKKKWYS